MGLGRKWGLSPLTVTALLVAVAGPDSMLYFFGGMAPRSADAAAGGAADRLSGENISNSVELDLQNLPLVVPEKEVKPNFPSQPQECAFSSKDGEKTSIRLTLTPAQGASFRCPGDSDLVQPPTHDEHAFRLASDGSCDTSKVFPFPGLLIENSPANQGVSHKRLSVPGWSLVEEKKACYVCRGKTGENAGKTCTVVVSVPPAPHLTNVASCDPETRTHASFAAFPSDEKADLSVTFSCRSTGAEMGLEPEFGSQKARTGDYCLSLASLNEIAEGASLIRTGSSGGTSTYKLTLKSHPKSPRLFCFRCMPPEDSQDSRCAVAIYAPVARKNGGGGQFPGQKPGEGEAVDVVVSTTTKPTSRGEPVGPSWSSLMYITVFSAISAGAGNWLFV